MRLDQKFTLLNSEKNNKCKDTEKFSHFEQVLAHLALEGGFQSVY